MTSTNKIGAVPTLPRVITAREINRRLSNVNLFFTLLALKTQQFITYDPTTWHGTREATVKVVDSYLLESKNMDRISGIENKVRDFLKSDLNKDGSNIHVRALCGMQFFGRLEMLRKTTQGVALSDLILRANSGLYDLKNYNLENKDVERILELAEKVVGLT